MMKWKRNNYRFWHSPLVLILLFIILLFFGYKIIDLINKKIETSYKKELILEKIDYLQKREVSLSNDILRIDTDIGKEEIIREKYQVAKKGEKIVIIVDERINDSKDKKEDNLNGFWDWIKSIFKK